MQYDFGKTEAGGKAIRTGSLNAPPTFILNALSKLRSNHYGGKSNLGTHLFVFDDKPFFSRENAEGVYLWASLIIKDIKSGIRNLGDLETLNLRLGILPHTIEDLCAYMLGSVSKLYRTEAAVYFHLLLADPERMDCTLTLLHTVFADREVHSHFLAYDWAYYKSQDFTSRYDRIETRIYTCCAGLIEIKKETGEYDIGSASYCRKANFIHRSVTEFIVERRLEFFKDTDWKHNTRLTLLDCNLGFRAHS